MNPMRECIARVLEGVDAFVRCDRGKALYVTDLPARDKAWESRARELDAAGFDCMVRGALLALMPRGEWYGAFESWALTQTDKSGLTRQLEKRRGCPICAEETACWLLGVKKLELGASFRDDYEKAVRQTAAVALRKHCGGLLVCCGLCMDLMGRNER